MSVASLPPGSSAAYDAVHWANAVPDGHAPDPPVVNGNDEMSFSDFLSAINPLQHLPVIGSLYRSITGDTINPAAQVLGGALLGGPIGLIFAAINAVIAEATGSDIGDKVIALVSPGRDEPSEIEKLAQGRATPAGEPELPVEGWAPPPTAVVGPPPTVALSPEQQAVAAALAKGATGEPAPAQRPLALAAAKPAAPLESGAKPHDLAFYWRQAESRPVIATGPMPTAASRVLPFSRPISIPAAAPVAAAVTPPPPAKADAASTPTAAVKADGPAPAAAPVREDAPSAWFAAAMAQGLDRYEASKRRPERGISLDRAE